MKVSRLGLQLTIALTLVALMLSSLISVYSAEQPVVSKKELKVLLKTAKEPVDHQKIAAYYRHEAQRLRLSAREHQEWGDIYAKGPAGAESKHPGMTNGAPHCHKWADLEEQEAKEADALAAEHDEMAKASEQK